MFFLLRNKGSCILQVCQYKRNVPGGGIKIRLTKGGGCLMFYIKQALAVLPVPGSIGGQAVYSFYFPYIH